MSNPYELILLALVIWREARGESIEAKLGVACVVRNRKTHPGWWGHTIIGVITRKWQFTSMTGAGDPNLRQWPMENDPSWRESMDAATDILDVNVSDNTGGATYYHDSRIARPTSWGNVSKTVQFGNLTFYKEE